MPVARTSLAKHNSKQVYLKGSNDKCSIITFVVTLAGQFLDIQLIYGGKTRESLPRLQHPKEFIKFIEEILVLSWNYMKSRIFRLFIINKIMSNISIEDKIYNIKKKKEKKTRNKTTSKTT